MTRLYNPSHFAHEAIDGFVAAHREWVGRVAGGVVSAYEGSYLRSTL